MGKEKIEEKDVRLLRYAVEQAFDGAMRDGEPAKRHKSVAEYKAENLRIQAELDEKTKQLESVTAELAVAKDALKTAQDAAKKAKDQVTECETKLDGYATRFKKIKTELAQIAGAWSYDVYGLHVAHDGKKEKKPLRAEWLVHELTDAGEEV